MGTKTDSKILVTSSQSEGEIVDALIEEADEIMKLAKLRDTMSLGCKSALRTKSENYLTEEIRRRVDTLSANIIQRFRPLPGDDSE
jgi:hypothetical protein